MSVAPSLAVMLKPWPAVTFSLEQASVPVTFTAQAMVTLPETSMAVASVAETVRLPSRRW